MKENITIEYIQDAMEERVFLAVGMRKTLCFIPSELKYRVSWHDSYSVSSTSFHDIQDAIDKYNEV